MEPAENIRSELESFREQWRAEVRARKPTAGYPGQGHQVHTAKAGSSRSSVKASRTGPARRHSTHLPAVPDEDDGHGQPSLFDDSGELVPAPPERDVHDMGKEPLLEPVSALDHYEEAVEKETVGSLGDSLRLYRKAFRMDSKVDQEYKNKHFAAAWAPNPQQQNPSSAPVTVPKPVHHPAGPPQPIEDLIASFATFAIQPAAPIIEGDVAPPCPIARSPAEVLLHIAQDVATTDVGDFVRLAQVCKRFAYIVATDEPIWCRVCQGSEFGFGGMPRYFQKSVEWKEIDDDIELSEALDPRDVIRRRERESLATTNALHHSLYRSSWQAMFRQRPRIRFNGCYISTVNYIRSGQGGAGQVTWNSPVHIVTYYRYLRFFRDGTCLSLLTTSEPRDVVHHLAREAAEKHHDGASGHPKSVAMQAALRGRWRLASPTVAESGGEADEAAEAEGDLFIETEGVGPKYLYRMDFGLRTAGKGTRNNKLVWKGFYNYNKLTDDWAEFELKNDKPFFFSRVKSYGVGG